MMRLRALAALTVLLATIPESSCDGGHGAVDASGGEVGLRWTGTTVRDLQKEYRTIFRKGTRNAASHLWRCAPAFPVHLDLAAI